VLLAQRQQIRKLARATSEPGRTLIPLKVYFVRGRAKVLIGTARGRRKADNRQVIDRREARRELRRAMER
jgi:SsrA-binding protein